MNAIVLSTELMMGLSKSFSVGHTLERFSYFSGLLDRELFNASVFCAILELRDGKTVSVLYNAGEYSL